jgi:hypothetical protein
MADRGSPLAAYKKTAGTRQLQTESPPAAQKKKIQIENTSRMEN